LIKRLFLPFLFLILCEHTVSAQFKYDIPQFYTETGHYFTSPLRWEGSDFVAFGGSTIATIAAALLESPAHNALFNPTTRPFYNSFPASFGEFYGGLWTPFILVGGFGGYSLITGDKTSLKIAFEIGQSCLYAGAVVFALKTAVGRARPYTGEGKNSFHPFGGILDDPHHSFPSGHVTEAFAMSTILAYNADPLWLKILAYVPAAFTPFSRAYRGYHWISDCVFGAGIGYFTAKWCTDAHAKSDDSSKSSIELKSLWPLTVSVALR
jgi:membrane-associated phospholipid phosphatase